VIVATAVIRLWLSMTAALTGVALILSYGGRPTGTRRIRGEVLRLSDVHIQLVSRLAWAAVNHVHG
jgi:hypothetical protein